MKLNLSGKKENLIRSFEDAVIKQAIYFDKEDYLKSFINYVFLNYPELLNELKDKLSFLDKSKDEKISLLIDYLSSLFPDIPSYLIKKSKEMYSNDKREFSQIGKEIFEFSNKIKFAENIIKKEISDDVLNNSILLIGPMGSGKSSVSRKLYELTGMNKVSLDDDRQLKELYEHASEFKNFKEFEFYLTSSVLTSINEPTIIDFGGGHSVYENPIMFYEMKKLIKKFKNTFLMLPSKDLNESLRILNERLSSRKSNIDNASSVNKYFLESKCNYELASYIIHTKDMKVEEIANMILMQIKNKKMEEEGIKK